MPEHRAEGPDLPEMAATTRPELSSQKTTAVGPDTPRWTQRLQSLLTRRVRDQLDWMGYTLGEPVGGGAFGVVLAARDRRMERPVAIKLIELPEVVRAGAPKASDEMRRLANLRHPHVVPLFTAGTLDGRMMYLVMPWMPGATLRQRLTRRGTLLLEETLRIGIDLADALAALHESGLVHRDVKPDNVMLEGDHAMLIDLGLVCAVRTEPLADPDETYVIGTPAYMSPEQWRAGAAIDGRADVYALGCLLFELLAGEPPYTPRPREARSVNAHRWTESLSTKDDLSGWQAAYEGPVASVLDRRPEIPRAVDRLLRKSIDPDRAKRFASARELRAALEAVQHHHHQSAGRRPLPPQRIAAALMAAALVGVAAFQYRTPPSGSPPVVGSMSGLLENGAPITLDTHRVLLTPVQNRTGDRRADSLATRLSIELERALLERRPVSADAGVIFVPSAVPLPPERLEQDLLGAVTGVVRTTRAGVVLAARLDARGGTPVLQVELVNAQTGQTKLRLPPTAVQPGDSDGTLQRTSSVVAHAIVRALANNNEY